MIGVRHAFHGLAPHLLEATLQVAEREVSRQALLTSQPAQAEVLCMNVQHRTMADSVIPVSRPDLALARYNGSLPFRP